MYYVREITAFRGGILSDSASYLCSSVLINFFAYPKTSSAHSLNCFNEVVYLYEKSSLVAITYSYMYLENRH